MGYPEMTNKNNDRGTKEDYSSDPTTTGSPGLMISATETICSFLVTASANPNLSQHRRDLSSFLSIGSSVPYQSLRSIWSAFDPTTRPNLKSLLSGSHFIFSSPKPREKSEELKERLRKLGEAAERKAYQELVKDITPNKGVEEPFSSYKDQLGFGLHVALTMFTGYLVGYAAFRALFGHTPAMSAAGGILGLVGGMLVETFLFIIKTSGNELKPTHSASSLKKNQ